MNFDELSKIIEANIILNKLENEHSNLKFKIENDFACVYITFDEDITLVKMKLHDNAIRVDWFSHFNYNTEAEYFIELYETDEDVTWLLDQYIELAFNKFLEYIEN